MKCDVSSVRQILAMGAKCFVFSLLLACGMMISSSCSERRSLHKEYEKAISLETKDWEKILNTLGTELLLSKNDPELMQEYCLQLVNAESYSRALKVCRTLVQLEKGKPQLADLYWGILAKNEIIPESDPLFKRYYTPVEDKQKRIFSMILDSIHQINAKIGQNPLESGLYETRSRLFYMINEKLAADWDTKKCLHTNPDNPDALYSLAYNYFEAGNNKNCLATLDRYQKAVAKFRVDLNNGFPKFFEMAQKLNKLDDEIKTQSNKTPLYIQRARIYMDAQQYAHAILDLNEVLRTDPSNPNLLCLRAFANNELGKTAEAKSDLQRAENISGKKYPQLDQRIFR